MKETVWDVILLTQVNVMSCCIQKFLRNIDVCFIIDVQLINNKFVFFKAV